MASKYSVVILLEKEEDNLLERKQFPVPSLDEARSLFSHHALQLKWSRQHKVNMGLKGNDHGRVWLFDNTCHYELEEARF